MWKKTHLSIYGSCTVHTKLTEEKSVMKTGIHYNKKTKQGLVEESFTLNWVPFNDCFVFSWS